ncbi:hypothetical protein [Rhizobium leguminosarum]|uniref:hypothetical protein n=1 Tax=Rhizobium leguminosarum TaxID=384 RepID=UPI001C95F48D|nr:hypothetical protein [Rhizobium leguminosarum]MBY5422337.1 hypothetical protein [Rhizobium leguminosarum]
MMTMNLAKGDLIILRGRGTTRRQYVIEFVDDRVLVLRSGSGSRLYTFSLKSVQSDISAGRVVRLPAILASPEVPFLKLTKEGVAFEKDRQRMRAKHLDEFRQRMSARTWANEDARYGVPLSVDVPENTFRLSLPTSKDAQGSPDKTTSGSGEGVQ